MQGNSDITQCFVTIFVTLVFLLHTFLVIGKTFGEIPSVSWIFLMVPYWVPILGVVVIFGGSVLIDVIKEKYGPRTRRNNKGYNHIRLIC